MMPRQRNPSIAKWAETRRKHKVLRRKPWSRSTWEIIRELERIAFVHPTCKSELSAHGPTGRFKLNPQVFPSALSSRCQGLACAVFSVFSPTPEVTLQVQYVLRHLFRSKTSRTHTSQETKFLVTNPWDVTPVFNETPHGLLNDGIKTQLLS